MMSVRTLKTYMCYPDCLDPGVTVYERLANQNEVFRPRALLGTNVFSMSNLVEIAKNSADSLGTYTIFRKKRPSKR